MKQVVLNTLNILAYVMLVSGFALALKGLYELNANYAHHADPTPLIVCGIALIISFPFTMGFRYIVQAALEYLEKQVK